VSDVYGGNTMDVTIQMCDWRDQESLKAVLTANLFKWEQDEEAFVFGEQWFRFPVESKEEYFRLLRVLADNQLVPNQIQVD